ncbi:MAG: hypothetical protein JXQ67_01655 [Campylobacterales bacterium]|nr:hypothetical protein [Campylobacterales bacterium]
MSKMEKIKKTLLIALGFGLATYLLINGFAILEQEKKKEQLLESERNASGEIHSNTVE